MRKEFKFLFLLLILFLFTGCRNSSINEEGTDITNSTLASELLDMIHMPYLSNYYSYYYENDKVLASDLPNDAKILLAANKYLNDNSNRDIIPDVLLKTEMINIFGEDVSYNDESISLGPCFGEVLTYSNNNYYVKGGCGETGPVASYIYKLIDAREYDDEIIIKEKVAYITYDDDWTPYATSYTRNVYKNAKGKFISSEEGTYTFDIDKYLKKLDTYKYVFKKAGNRTYFYSVNREKM